MLRALTKAKYCQISQLLPRLKVNNNIIISGGISTFSVEAVLYSPK